MTANPNVQAVFIDRDGTIGGTGHFIHPRDFELYPNAQEAITLLKQNGMKVFALTNQHRIQLLQLGDLKDKNIISEYEFDQKKEKLLAKIR